MGLRILSAEERGALAPDAVSFIYKMILGYSATPDIIEKVLIQAVLISRLEQRILDAEVVEYLFDRIAENDDPFFSEASSPDIMLPRWLC